MRFLFGLACSLVLLNTAKVNAQNLRLGYTGQLLGYYREDLNTPHTPDISTPPDRLREELRTLPARVPTDGPVNLLLGMGDNFAPEYGAALAWRNNPNPDPDCKVPLPPSSGPKPIPYPRFLYKTDFTAPQKAECDNVAAFLMKSGYRAVVPGKEDFLYGSFWLSRIARSFTSESLHGNNTLFKNDDRQLHMLAANLRLQVVGSDGKPFDQCPLLFSESDQWTHASLCAAGKDLDPKEALENVAYTSTSLGGANTLIIGVLAQNLLDAVSSENRTFCATTAGKGFGYLSYKVARCPAKDGMIQAKAIISDPLQAVVHAIESALASHPKGYDAYVIMAQMTRGEAEELAAKLQARRTADAHFPAISLVLSSAFAEQSSGTYTLSANKKSDLGLVPVLTPHPAYDSGHLNHQVRPLIDPLSLATLTEAPGSYTMKSESSNQALKENPAKETTLGLLLAEIQPSQARIPEHVLSPETMFSTATMKGPCDARTLITNSTDQKVQKQIDECNVQAMQYILAAMRNIKPWTNDVVFLERRDFFFGTLPDGYIDYDMCDKAPNLSSDEKRRCHLQVALDRVLWKGDYLERVMATGADISAMIAASDNLSAQTNQLQQPTTTGSWLQTFGLAKTGQVAPAVVVPPVDPNDPEAGAKMKNFKAVATAIAGQSSTKFAIPTDPNCVPFPDPVTGQSKPTYCILSNSIEQTPQKDGGFWIATSDHLASDTTTYPALSKLPSTYRVTYKDGEGGVKYLTEAIADSLFIKGLAPGQRASSNLERVDAIHGPEISTQQHRHFQFDSAKIFFGYLDSRAEGGDSYLANNYQGASDTRASAVSQYELDAEAQLRGLWTWGFFRHNTNHALHMGVGFQTDVEYDRSAQGNLNGSADNASYGANNWAIGPLYQFAYPLKPGTRPANYGFMKTAQWAFVVNPQFQRQVRGTDLFFTYSSSSPKVGKDELTVPIDYSYGWNVKEGFRFTAAASSNRLQLQPGSYLETGIEEGEQHHVLNSIQLSNITGAKLFCAANSAQPISSCVGSASKGASPTFPLSSTTAVSALMYSDQPAHGLYWDISLKWKLFKSVNNFHEMNFVAASKGDAFVRRSYRDVLSTQTLYDIPLTLGVTFQVLPNLSFSPSGNFFFYSNQVAEQQLLIRGFNITMRWYYDRDSHTPFLRQLFLLGPSSQDQTKMTKMKQTP